MYKVPGSVVKVVEHGGKTYDIRGSNYERAVHFSFPKGAVGPVSKTLIFAPPRTKLVALEDFTESAVWAGDYDGALSFEGVTVLIKRTADRRVIIHYAVERTAEGTFQALSREAHKIMARLRRDLKKLEAVAEEMERIVDAEGDETD